MEVLMEAALCPAQQPWSPTGGGLGGRLTVSSSSFPKRKLFLILAAVETAYINIISTAPTSSFSFLKYMFHDQKPCPVCVWSWYQPAPDRGRYMVTAAYYEGTMCFELSPSPMDLSLPLELP